MKKLTYIFLINLCALSALSNEESPLHQPSTLLWGGANFNSSNLRFGHSVSTTLSNSGQVGLGFEVPIVEYFNLGFNLSGTMGYGNYSTLVDLGVFLKPQVPIYTAGGDLAVYIKIPLGISLDFWFPYAHPVMAKEVFNLMPIGPGFHGSGLGGIEYFPLPEIGFYVEGGYTAHIFWHKMFVQQHGSGESMEYKGFARHAPVVYGGLKMNFL